jgi:Cu-Zn family superoxide dismutase
MVKHATAAAVLLTVPALVLSACSAEQHATTQPGTTPPVWTGETSPAEPPTAAPDSGAETLTAQLRAPDGTPVAEATIEFAGGYATVTVETIGDGILSPGFHGTHIHTVGKCEPNSAAPTGGPRGAFLSAGDHFQAPGHSAWPPSGDLPNLQVRDNGAAKLVTTTDAFTAAQLLDGNGAAIIIHELPSNFGNIPPERYQQINGSPPPDRESLATGDSGGRVACGVVEG